MRSLAWCVDNADEECNWTNTLVEYSAKLKARSIIVHDKSLGEVQHVLEMSHHQCLLEVDEGVVGLFRP